MMETTQARARNHARPERRLLFDRAAIRYAFPKESALQGRAGHESRFQSEISASVNTLKDTSPPKFSIREFVFASPSGSQFPATFPPPIS